MENSVFNNNFSTAAFEALSAVYISAVHISNINLMYYTGNQCQS